MRRLSDLKPSDAYTSEEAAEYGLSRRVLTVVKFHDQRTGLRWFMRDVEELGKVETTVIDGCNPLFPEEVMAFVRQHYGADAGVLW